MTNEPMIEMPYKRYIERLEAATQRGIEEGQKRMSDWPECKEFYDLMQTYRHWPATDQAGTFERYNEVRQWLAAQSTPQGAMVTGEQIHQWKRDAFERGWQSAIEAAAKTECCFCYDDIPLQENGKQHEAGQPCYAAAIRSLRPSPAPEPK